MSTRKLQQEFDKLQKKVNEGLQQFEEIYEKIGVTENPSLKDKLEGDLRKEIKKLQRSRDQVKQWLSDSSNKLDKAVLLDTRLRIENAMERFKEVEKVLKMKQFSNEGLELQAKLGARGLEEARKNDASRYIIDVLDELARQNELLLGEMAQYLHKKKLTAAQTALADLAAKVDRNNSHVLRLELVLRGLENGQLEPEKIDEIKDDLDYYVENNQLSDFVEYDDFYDLLALDESVEVLPTLAANPLDVSLASASPKKEKESVVKENEKSDKEKTEKEKHEKERVEKEKAEKTEKPVKKAEPRVTITIGNSINASLAPSTANLGAATSQPPTSAPAAGATSGTGSGRAPPPGLNPQSKPGTPTPAKLTVAEELKRKAMTHAAAAASALKSPAKAPPVPSPVAVASETPEKAAKLEKVEKQPAANVAPSVAANLETPLPVHRQHKAVFWDNSADVAALAHARLTNPPPFSAISAQLEASLLNCPDSFDLEKPRQYNPTNVHPSSVDYPQEPMFELNLAQLMRKFDTDTLFFCFYYNEAQDALAKWHAARELSRRGWVFNTETKQWFCKDKPKARSILAGLNGDNTASASYKYFDYESSWLVRRKDNFEFAPELQQTF